MNYTKLFISQKSNYFPPSKQFYLRAYFPSEIKWREKLFDLNFYSVSTLTSSMIVAILFYFITFIVQIWTIHSFSWWSYPTTSPLAIIPNGNKITILLEFKPYQLSDLIFIHHLQFLSNMSWLKKKSLQLWKYALSFCGGFLSLSGQKRSWDLSIKLTTME